jgi:signal transduction histidine kinase
MTTDTYSSTAVKRLLVVDDEEGPRESLNMIFCDEFEVTIATSGEEAVALSRESPFDVVITDIRMCGMSGIDVLRAVKEINASTEVIVLTAYETLDTARQAISFGASEYLKKPFDLDHIQKVVDRCYQNHLIGAERETLIRQDVNAAKNSFLEIVSHELNTPMHGIIGYIELLEDTRLDAEQREYMETIRDCSLKYFENVQDILTYAQLSMSETEVSESSFNPATLLLKLIQEISDRKESDIQLHLPEDLPQYVKGSEQEIRVVLRKLLQNSVKFAANSEIRVTVGFEYTSMSKIQLKFEVSDTGPGIDPQYIETGVIFDAFSQGDSSLTREHEGLGLGLALCQSLTKRLGGELTVQSELGEGSRFTFVVDVRSEEL